MGQILEKKENVGIYVFLAFVVAAVDQVEAWVKLDLCHGSSHWRINADIYGGGGFHEEGEPHLFWRRPLLPMKER